MCLPWMLVWNGSLCRAGQEDTYRFLERSLGVEKCTSAAVEQTLHSQRCFVKKTQGIIWPGEVGRLSKDENLGLCMLSTYCRACFSHFPWKFLQVRDVLEVFVEAGGASGDKVLWAECCCVLTFISAINHMVSMHKVLLVWFVRVWKGASPALCKVYASLL